ncbi:cysteine-rich receptor-like protein kinase 8 [Tanacetum coccineum]
MDTARAFRFHSKLPLKFWGDCITTATYLVNIIPSSVIGNKTPYEVILKKKPMYEHLKVFGCLAMVSNTSRTADKFDPRGVPCIFLGYPSNQKGYKFYNLTTYTNFISRDVVFHETVFPYASDSIQHFIKPLPATFPCQFHSENTYDDFSFDTVLPHENNSSNTVTNPNIQTPVSEPAQTSTIVPEIQPPQLNSYDFPPLPTRKSTRTTDSITALLAQKDPLTTLPAGKKAIGSHWIFKTKLKADGNVERKKARLVVNGNRQRHGVDYQETFSPVAKMVTLRSSQGIFISQHKYTRDLLKEGGVLNNKPYKLPIDPNLKLQADVGTPLTDLESPTSVHMQAVKHVLRYFLNSPGQGILLANDYALQLKAYCDSDWASCLMTKRSITGYCILLGDLPISWKSKKQAVVSRSLAEAEYRAMALTCYEVTWLVSLLKELGIKDLEPVDLYCDNQVALYIAENPVFHARTKHIEVDCHYVRDQLKAGIIKPSYVHTKSYLTDVFTKVVYVDQHTKLLSKLGVSKAINTQLEGECTKERGSNCIVHSL